MTLWFVMGGVAWLPLLYLAYSVGSLPFVGSLGAEYSDLFFSAGFVTLWVFTVGSGPFYYTLVKDSTSPSPRVSWLQSASGHSASPPHGGARRNSSLAPGRVGSTACRPPWAWPSPLEPSPMPPMPRSPSRGTGRSCGTSRVSPQASLALPGGGGGHPGHFAAFPSVGSVTALTGYWEAIEYVALYGVGVLLAAGVVFEALPRISGREPATLDRPRSFNRWTAVGVGGVGVSMIAAGLVERVWAGWQGRTAPPT